MKDSFIHTRLGWLKVTTENEAVKVVSFMDAYQGDEIINSEAAGTIKQQLTEYLEGFRKIFDLELKPEGTVFQQKVWSLLQKIPFGKTITYQQQALQMGDVKSIRAVASANGKNPIAILIPCHRVIGTDGSLTGYAGGIHRKQSLLELESGTKQSVLF